MRALTIVSYKSNEPLWRYKILQLKERHLVVMHRASGAHGEEVGWVSCHLTTPMWRYATLPVLDSKKWVFRILHGLNHEIRHKSLNVSIYIFWMCNKVYGSYQPKHILGSGSPRASGHAAVFAECCRRGLFIQQLTMRKLFLYNLVACSRWF